MFAFGKEMLTGSDEEVEGETDFLEDCPQFTSKTKTGTFCLGLQQAKCSADQENAGKGLKYWRGEWAGYSSRPTKGFVASGVPQPDRLSSREKAKGRKEKQHSKMGQGNMLIKRKK